MSSDQKTADPEQPRLAEYQILERVEGRLWSRARLILVATFILILLVALLGVPLIEDRIERRVLDRAERLVTERLVAGSVDVPAIRKEMREETAAQRQELLRSQFAVESRIATLLERTKELDAANKELVGGSEEYAKVKEQTRQILLNQKNEEERLHKLRTTYEKELAEFREQSQSIAKQIPRTIGRQLKYVEDTVNRDLDELRLIIADQVEGKPAIYSTYVNLAQRDGQVTGVNFGEERGNVFVRLRAFEPGSAIPIRESGSILLQSTQWNGTRINLRFPAPALEKLQEERQAVAKTQQTPPTYRYGFVVQTSDGKMSQWSGLRADTLIPPTDVKPKDD